MTTLSTFGSISSSTHAIHTLDGLTIRSEYLYLLSVPSYAVSPIESFTLLKDQSLIPTVAVIQSAQKVTKPIQAIP